MQYKLLIYRSKLKDNKYLLLFILILVFALISLISAYFTEFVLGYKPCPLCLYQRIPYFLIIPISIISILYRRTYKLGLFLTILCVFSSIIIAGYHSGVERKIFHPMEICTRASRIDPNISPEEYLKLINNQELVSCTEAPFKVLGLSMAEYNFLINILALYVIVQVISKGKNYAKT